MRASRAAFVPGEFLLWFIGWFEGEVYNCIEGEVLRGSIEGRGGGVGGVVRPPPVAHPKDFVPPFSNFVPPFSNFVPPFSNFVPPLEYVDDVTRTMSKGGGVLVNVQEWGRFSN